MILVIGSGSDPHVQAVLHCLKEFKSQALLLDAYELESEGVRCSLSDNVKFTLGRNQVPLSDISSIWWRQKAKHQIPAGSVLGLYDYSFVQREWNTIFDFLATSTDKSFSINDRHKAKLAENKAFQLKVASEFLLNTPRTIITNRFEQAAEYFERAGVRKCVYKSFSPYMPPNATIAYTTELDIAEMYIRSFQETADTTPGIFQELIEADYEIRVTVIGDKVFSARIDTPENQGVDWRTSIFKNRYSILSLPKYLEEELLRYHNRLGLVFAAYDFIVNSRQDIFFLEVNPSGQWMWLEQQLGMPISAAIAEKLHCR
ncbi:hypothetical protein LT980_14485 [Citrobacter portucalensis]|uniref:hypothetical protein n=1 Tax=Citrobacter portucalensis TaxID=1639133 RepID=UPI00202D0C39|nr:hypothetical protein [Citrobacter portucalensis]URR11152.1 hypothetical protein LT980_14485 [Citrobacter portucalensis]